MSNDGLRRIRVEGFASIRDMELEPGRLTILIGSNGAGKSSLLKVLKLVPLLRTKSLERFVGDAGGAGGLLHYGPKRTPVINIELEFGEEDRCNGYQARLGFAAGDKLLFLDEQVGYKSTPSQEMRIESLGGGHFESVLQDAKGDNQTAKAINYWLSQMTFFHFHDTSVTSALRTQARAEGDYFLRSDGANLPAFLRRLEQSEDESDQKAWRRINHYVQRIAPCIKTLSPTPFGNGGRGVRLNWIDQRDEVFGAHHLSDGTLRAVALVTALAQPTSSLPRFVSIDEPELGLHPAAITLLAELARSVSRRTQVLFATQSTAFLDHFEANEVVVVENNAGESEFTRPDPGDLKKWLDDYSLSEIFDKGVLGGRP